MYATKDLTHARFKATEIITPFSHLDFKEIYDELKGLWLNAEVHVSKF
jgi:hypothetical protein